GCGWLGFPLAKAFILDGFSIKGSTTSEDKLLILKNNNINPYLISLNENEIIGNIDGFLNNSEILIIDIPPKLRGNSKENFVSKIKNLISFVEKSSVKKVLFVSSTSVYGDNNSVVTEETIPNPDTESGKQLWQVEKLLQSNKNFETTILRFGGLIGNDRHPIKYMAGRENLENPDAPVNLIHQNDCIGIIKKIIETEIWNDTFNAVHPFHPTRKDYYTQKAKALQLTIPTFNLDSKIGGKIISSHKIEQQLNYTFVTSI
ncbi:SDR family NAD(P)-dependent oxidoreductase, partial [Flavobacterium sp.]|uniref:SDR family NAD(P)-dependent oxidoreductase n=1 Tax=Flavobacterium sp. TaxID=239 RepID=UPI00286C07E6